MRRHSSKQKPHSRICSTLVPKDETDLTVAEYDAALNTVYMYIVSILSWSWQMCSMKTDVHEEVKPDVQTDHTDSL